MLLEYTAAFGSGTFVSTKTRFDFPGDDWTMSLSFSSSTSYLITKRLQAVVEVYAVPECPGKRMRHWKVALDAFPGEDNRAVAVDPAQDLLLVFQTDRSTEW